MEKLQPGAINWFEIPATNLKRARDFYTKIFDWEFSELPESWDKEGGKTNPEYLTFSKKGTMVMGGMPLVSEESMLNVDREGIVSVRLSMVVVDMEDALKRIVEAGGRVIK